VAEPPHALAVLLPDEELLVLARGNTDARRTSLLASAPRRSMRAATTACTVGGSSRPETVSRTVPAGASASACSIKPVVSTMKNGLPPACLAIRSAVSASMPSAASSARATECFVESGSR
jgi:hypothetical protein